MWTPQFVRLRTIHGNTIADFVTELVIFLDLLLLFYGDLCFLLSVLSQKISVFIVHSYQ